MLGFNPLLAAASRRVLAAAHARPASGDASGGKNVPASADAADSKTGGPDFKPLKLSYQCLEDKRPEVASRRPPLVLHHSLLGCRKNWNKVAKEVHHLTHRKVVNLDCRNHGDSPHSRDMSYSLLAKDVHHLIRHLGADRVAFLGHSMGGRVGMILALTQPQLVERLVCVDATPVNTPVALDRWETLGRACRQLRRRERELRAKEGVQRTMLADQIVRPFLPVARDRSLFLSNLLTPSSKYNSGSSGSSGSGGKKEEGGKSSSSDDQRLWRLNVDMLLGNNQMPASFPTFTGVTYDGPALFIAGENSKFLRREHQPYIRKLFPNSRVVWLKGKNAGHWIHEDKHEEFMQAVVPFLEEADGATNATAADDGKDVPDEGGGKDNKKK